MTGNSVLFYFFIFFISLSCVYLNRFLFLKYSNFKNQIPSGVGFFFSLILIFLSNIYFDQYFSFFLYIFLLGLIYLIDDYYNLNFKIRITLQVSLGFLIFIYFNQNFNINSILLLLFFIFLSFGLTNFLNFHDGADLNVSVLLIAFLITQFFLSDPISEIRLIIISALIFQIVFLYYNNKKLIYFGDSGCYVFTGIIIFLIFENFYLNKIFFFLICFSFQLLDTLVFLFIRLKNKENLLTRGYYHLYQNLNNNYGPIYYLIPGLFNIILLLIVFFLYNKFDFNFFDIFIIFIITSINYSFIRFLFYK